MYKAFIFIALTAWLAVAADVAPPHVRHCFVVNPNLLRGGEPTMKALQELHDVGVTTVIDLRGPEEDRAPEERGVKQLGMKYVNVPFSGFSAPKQAQVEEVLKLLTAENPGKIYVHCRRGKDRTGTVVACYRIQHDGWTNQRALDEAKQHGMSSLERAMQAYILKFTPVKTLLPVF